MSVSKRLIMNIYVRQVHLERQCLDSDQNFFCNKYIKHVRPSEQLTSLVGGGGVIQLPSYLGVS